ncbi:hypothetical protein [Alteribacter populi]|uniref:hypothetical protein n=1 Tax=Alteribacter populi TaxID=2011011 RepID=UPI000BBA6F66|nr:hypothetical protein [Alteribacter populi]
MFDLLMVMFFILIAGIAVGALITTKLVFAWNVIFTITGLLFFFFVWVGMLLGGWVFGWFPAPVLKGTISFLAIILAVLFFRIYHPSYGFIPTQGVTHWGALAVFFFFIGLEMGTMEISAWSILLFVPAFAAGIMVSAWVTWKLKSTMAFRFLVQYVPILLFVFIAVLKLV